MEFGQSLAGRLFCSVVLSWQMCWLREPEMILLTCLAPLWGWLEMELSWDCLLEHPHTVVSAAQMLRVARYLGHPKKTRRKSHRFCRHSLRIHAALSLQHSVRYEWVIRPSHIQEKGDRHRISIGGHTVEELGKYCCSHLWKILSSTLASNHVSVICYSTASAYLISVQESITVRFQKPTFTLPSFPSP